MDLQATKLSVLQKIMEIDKPALLNKINILLDEEMIVGYTSTGKPLTKEAYNKRLKKAEKQLKTGNFLTQEELEKESENW